MIESFPNLPIIEHKQEETIEALKIGEIEDIRVAQQMPIDDIVEYGLDNKFLQEGLKSFPDPRASYDIPIEVMLLPQVVQRLDDEHSLVTAPYMLNSAPLLAKLGFSAKVLETGFNNKNTKPRKTVFDGSSLKHLLLQMKPDAILEWFNTSWNHILKENAPGRTHQYIIDGTKILIPKHMYEKFEGAGCVKTDSGDYEYGYKIVWIQEIIDRKGVLRTMKLAPINDHDLKVGKELVKDFNFEEGSLLAMDRGFFDGKWITHLKTERKVDVCIPLKKNSEVTQYAVSEAQYEEKWEPHPTRENQRICRLEGSDLDWKTCEVFNSGVLVNFKKKDGSDEYIVFVDTRKNIGPKKLLATYDLRSEIEEAHRQMKCFQGLEKLPSKKYVHVVFRIVMGTIAYNLFNLFLNSEKCETLDDFTLKTHRQKRREERNPDIIIYTEITFAIIKNLEFLPMILSLEKGIQKKLIHLFQNLSTETYSTA